jgi:hypothetical protein
VIVTGPFASGRAARRPTKSCGWATTSSAVAPAVALPTVSPSAFSQIRLASAASVPSISIVP